MKSGGSIVGVHSGHLHAEVTVGEVKFL